MSKEQAKKFLDELKARGLFYDCTSEEKLLINLIEKKTVYFGIDPTGPSLHLGHFLGLTLITRFCDFGCKIIVLIGNLTAAVGGDPSWKKNSRAIMQSSAIENNTSLICMQIKNFFEKNKVGNDFWNITYNHNFYKRFNTFFNFLWEICKSVNVKSLLDKKFLDERLENGLSVLEFFYPIFQSFDFYELNKSNDVFIQVGGQDQWGNISLGVELIRKKNDSNVNAVGLTFPLLLDNSNKKFGKSEDNALFLDEKLTKPYIFYQYLINLSDENAEKYIKMLTFLPLSDIEEIVDKHNSKKQDKKLQKKLAYEILSNIHGEEKAKKIENLSEILFSNNVCLSDEDFLEIDGAINKYEVEIKPEDIEDTTNSDIRLKVPISWEYVFKELKFWLSNSEFRRFFENGGSVYRYDKKEETGMVKIDQNEINVPSLDHAPSIKKDNKKIYYFLVRKGKKEYGLLKIITDWKELNKSLLIESYKQW